MRPTSTPTGRRPADGAGLAPSVIGPGAHFRGDLASEGPVEVHGTLEGDCQTMRATIRARVVGIQDSALFQGQIDKS